MHAPEQDLDHILDRTRDLWPELRAERLFLTGATGFVGAWLTESFVWANRRLRLGARATLLSRSPEAFRSRLPLAQDPAIDFLTGDGADFAYPTGTYSFAIHAANDPDVSRNLPTTERVLDFTRTHETKRLLFTSSGAAYGPQPPAMTHLDETYNGTPHATPYGESKRISESYCIAAGAIIARLFAFVGPYLPLDANFAAGNFIGDVLNSRPVHIEGDGTPYRSYLYAADLAIWIWTLLLRGQPGRIYNVGSPQALTIAELAAAVVKNTRPETPIIIAKSADPNVPSPLYVPSTERAKNELGLRVLIPLDEAIRRTYNWHRSSQADTL